MLTKAIDSFRQCLQMNSPLLLTPAVKHECYTNIILLTTKNIYFLILLQPKYRFKEGQGCRNVLGVRSIGGRWVCSNGGLIISWKKWKECGETPIQCLFVQQESRTKSFITEVGAKR